MEQNVLHCDVPRHQPPAGPRRRRSIPCGDVSAIRPGFVPRQHTPYQRSSHLPSSMGVWGFCRASPPIPHLDFRSSRHLLYPREACERLADRDDVEEDPDWGKECRDLDHRPSGDRGEWLARPVEMERARPARRAAPASPSATRATTPAAAVSSAAVESDPVTIHLAEFGKSRQPAHGGCPSPR